MGYKNVIKTKQLLQSLLAREDIKIDMAFLQNDLLIKLMNFQNQYTSKVMDMVDNILEIFSYRLVEKELKKEWSLEYLKTWDSRWNRRETVISFSQATIQKLVNALELIYESNSWSVDSDIDVNSEMHNSMSTWFNWFIYASRQEEFLFLPDQDVVNWKASVVAYVLQKQNPAEILRNG